MRLLFVRILRSAVLVCALREAARADPVEDLARIHLEAIGGRQRIDALSSLRATGVAYASGGQVRFTMLAARPAKIRIETEGVGRTSVQASDGVAPPWEYDSSATPARYRAMADSASRTFVNDAEFDDPLVTGASRGFTLDYGGVMQVDGRKLHRVLVTRRLTEPFTLLVDDETYFIVMRVEQRTSAGGRRLQVVTHFEDFRPVNGVLLPHKITTAIEGDAKQQTRITKMDANPSLASDAFTRPAVTAPATAAR